MSKVDAIGFTLRCKNWREIAVPIAKHQKPTTIILRNGFHFEAPAIHWWDIDDIFFKRVYNPTHLHIGSNDLVVDIGANIGVFTAFAASKTQNTVYSFEPSQSCFEFLRGNIRANRLKNVIPYNLAVSDKSGTELLLESVDSTARKLKSVKPEQTGEYKEVSTTTLQDIIDSNNIEQIDFLKMDCEGAEGSILSSTPKDQLKRIRKIAMEFHDGISKMKHDEMRKLLEELDFTTDINWNGRSRLGHLYAWRD
ncbi:MAG: FkbM family methyltransferase [Chloroflexota bacterium]|nr:FkbM family methyltransferase [Chloroflexota bacterium]